MMVVAWFKRIKCASMISVVGAIVDLNTRVQSGRMECFLYIEDKFTIHLEIIYQKFNVLRVSTEYILRIFILQQRDLKCGKDSTMFGAVC